MLDHPVASPAAVTAPALDPGKEETLPVTIRNIRELTARIRAFELVAEDGGALPHFTPGAHISVHLDSGGPAMRRSYSLVNGADDGRYEIAVLREDKGAGGSRLMHAMEVGDRLRISPPQNAFPLQSHAGKSLLIAGGIGITPILAMARALEAGGCSYELHYAARSESEMAYRQEAGSLTGARLYFDGGDPKNGIPLAQVLAEHAGLHVYVCGPAPLIKAVLDACAHRGWPHETVHHELFTGTIAQDSDASFELEMRASGITVDVPPDMSILDVAIAQGVFSPFECRRGECGMCATPVLEGAVLHRDHYLTDEERQKGDTMCICISRAAGRRLVLDL